MMLTTFDSGRIPITDLPERIDKAQRALPLLSDEGLYPSDRAEFPSTTVRRIASALLVLRHFVWRGELTDSNTVINDARRAAKHNAESYGVIPTGYDVLLAAAIAGIPLRPMLRGGKPRTGLPIAFDSSGILALAMRPSAKSGWRIHRRDGGVFTLLVPAISNRHAIAIARYITGDDAPTAYPPVLRPLGPYTEWVL